MTEQSYKDKPSEDWLEHESGGDPVLSELLQAKENFMDEIGRMGANDPYYKDRIVEINGMINDRQQELGIDPIVQSDTPT